MPGPRRSASCRSRPAAGAALRLLAAATQAKAVVEVGTGTGLSGLWLLRGMRPDGVLTSIDAEAEHQRLARASFTAEGVPNSRARLINGRALDVLPRLADRAYDIVFCSADRREYPDYLDQVVRLLRPGGVLIFDGASRAADATARDAESAAMRRLTEQVAEDGRLARHCCRSAPGCSPRPSSPRRPDVRRRRSRSSGLRRAVSIAAFYDADPRRRESEEVEYGDAWTRSRGRARDLPAQPRRWRPGSSTRCGSRTPAASSPATSTSSNVDQAEVDELRVDGARACSAPERGGTTARRLAGRDDRHRQPALGLEQRLAGRGQ